ncbi:hypothetical protein OEA41_008980 [Lepraria neglecta]|uniref:TACO1/YebC-like second and third domain-containing protein n=1 Tax=Lepraria neglecta TaxID=209136 RepID=A0AAD9Z2D9_9LECA|nr:hypothetical protein OEA41_008980 [Lepraria neglecta]
MNPRLATAVTAAKKIGFPKASIENAIARGQGVSPNGAALENLTIEAMVPPSVAVIIECQTDSKLRTLADLRLAVKEAGGSVTPTNHLFERKGRIVFEKSEETDEVDIMDQAIEAGAIDVDITSEDGTEEVVLLTESTQTTAVAGAMTQSSGLRLKSSEIIWDPKEDMMVDVNSPEALGDFLERIHDNPSVQDVYTNAN